MVEVQSTWIVVASVSLRPLLSRAGHVFAERTVGPSPPGRPGGLSAPPMKRTNYHVDLKDNEFSSILVMRSWSFSWGDAWPSVVAIDTRATTRRRPQAPQLHGARFFSSSGGGGVGTIL